MPGETAAPGTPSGKSGSPRPQVAGIAFDVTVRACDSSWNTITSVGNSILITSSDVSATLPSPAQLVSGQQVFQVTFNAAGSFNVLAHDQTDNTIPDGTSASVAVRCWPASRSRPSHRSTRRGRSRRNDAHGSGSQR
jgi:hypothetical protein